MLWSIHLLRICTYTSWCHTLYFFFLKDPPPTKISTLPLHDALPISKPRIHRWERRHAVSRVGELRKAGGRDALQRSRADSGPAHRYALGSEQPAAYRPERDDLPHQQHVPRVREPGWFRRRRTCC